MKPNKVHYLPFHNKGGGDRTGKGRKYYKTIWEDENNEGVIKQYTEDICYYYHYDAEQSPKYIRGYSNNYANILSAAKIMVDFKYDHTKWKQVRMKYGLFSAIPKNREEFRRKPFQTKNQYIYYDSRSNKWYIQKNVQGKLREFGRYSSLDEAEQVLEYLVENDWSLELLQKAKDSSMNVGKYFLGCVDNEEKK